MKLIDVSNLKKLGSGCECNVYALNDHEVIKCFKKNSWVRKETCTDAEDVWLAHQKLAELGLANPVGEFVHWTRKTAKRTFSGEGYICAKVKTVFGYEHEVKMLKKLAKHNIKLIDVHFNNCGLYKKELVLIDVGYDALQILEQV